MGIVGEQAGKRADSLSRPPPSSLSVSLHKSVLSGICSSIVSVHFNLHDYYTKMPYLVSSTNEMNSLSFGN